MSSGAGRRGGQGIHVDAGRRPSSSYRLEEPIVNTLRGKNGLHAFGNNSAESEPIRMKSGTVSQMRGLALADFGRDRHRRHRSDSLRRIVFPKKKQKMLT